MSLEDAIRAEVKAALEAALAPYLPKLSRPDKRLYTYLEAAQVLGVSDRHVAKLVANGVLHVVPEMGSRRLLRRVDVEAFADGRETPASLRLGGVGGAGISELEAAS